MVNKGSASLPRVPHAAQLTNKGGGGHTRRQPASGLHNLDPNAGGKVWTEMHESKELRRLEGCAPLVGRRFHQL